MGFLIYGTLGDASEPENLHGRNVYLRYGFQETGLYCGNEIVAKLEL